jgi:hypothetical protein
VERFSKSIVAFAGFAGLLLLFALDTSLRAEEKPQVVSAEVLGVG